MEHLKEIEKKIRELLQKDGQILVAIDGNCTSGKSTLAARLGEIFDCNVFHMDDFFLRPEQRTEERFGEVGGNVDYERFLQEILQPLQKGEAFSYRPFDCSTFSLAEAVQVQPKKLNIIEGTYSLHPYFGQPYDWKILLTLPQELQKQRVLQRPAFLHQRFFEQWIPMEDRYFAESGITPDLRIDTIEL